LAHYFTNENNLKSELRTVSYVNGCFSLVFNSDNGVFSKNHIDYGSNLLIETIIKNNPNKKDVLDVGCGYGFIGISLAKILNCNVTMVDINKRAVHLAEMNIKENKVNAKVIESNVYDNVKDKYDLIVTNPPIRAGKKIVLEILLKAKEFLNIDGELWFVIRKDQGAKSIAEELKKTYELAIVEKSKGFYIFKAKMC
jgi:16S rRNA (guanine1207-N2)-methyltransferase